MTMKRLTRFFVLLGLVACTALGHAQQVSVVEKELSNGMKLLMLPRKGEPTISGGWVARVGSANERPGITGIAHLFEHMMFKGTPTLGTKDYKKDLEIINEQERVRDLMRAEEAKVRDLYRKGEIDDPYKPENKTARYKELEKQFNELIKQQREIMVKNEFDRVYTAAGGSQMNAFTSTDMTAYFITVPANRLEFFMWMESERLLRPVFREFYAERDVVFEERRMRTESTPTGRLEEMFNAMFWESHPYSWPTVGWPALLSTTESHAHLGGRFRYPGMRCLMRAILRSHPERQATRARCRDAGDEADRREAHERRGGGEPDG
jgi:predicted Zn-dependent peptidase